MNVSRVLYLGEDRPSSTAYHRAQALRRLGLSVMHVNPYEATRGLGRVRGALHYRTGYRFLTGRVADRVLGAVEGQRFDLCWVDGGELLARELIEALHARFGPVVLFNHDDPSGPRDGQRFATLRRAVPAYALCLVVRPFNVDEFRALGAPDALHVWRTYDEVEHAPLDRNAPVPEAFRSDVAFIGRNIPGEGRDRLLAELIRAGIKVAVWGDNWDRSSCWGVIEPHWRGASLSGQRYVDAIRGAKLCLGMLSAGNRDDHTTRTMEIPYAGGLLCAQRTEEHRALYVEGVEAVFWSGAPECLAQCLRLLADEPLRNAVRAAGHARVLKNEVGNQDMCIRALRHLGLAVQPPP